MLELLAVAPKTYNLDEIMPYPPYPLYRSGVTDGTNSIYRYALKESNYPILIIVDPIFDEEGSVIPSGHYSLALTDERDLLIIYKNDKVIATLTVFKYEEDKTQIEKKEKTYFKEWKRKRAKKKKEKKDAKMNAKRVKQGLPLLSDPIYMEASIEYNKDGKYYLIKYERARIRAWGA